MPSRTTIEKRLTCLENFWSERCEQVYRERLHECSVKLTQAERRARIVLLVEAFRNARAGTILVWISRNVIRIRTVLHFSRCLLGHQTSRNCHRRRPPRRWIRQFLGDRASEGSANSDGKGATLGNSATIRYSMQSRTWRPSSSSSHRSGGRGC